MKKLIYFSIFIIAVVATAQTNRFPPINWYPGDPTGTACTVNSPLLQSQNYGFIYGCNLSTLVYGPVSSSVYGYLPLTGGTLTGTLNGTSASFLGSLAAANMASIGPLYDVTQFGAIGDGKTDDTAAIQAAFDTCQTGGAGIIEFPGRHSYIVSQTINAHAGCQIAGGNGNSANGGSVNPSIQWRGTPGGVVYNITAVTTGPGTTTTPAAPSSAPWSFYATFTATNSLVAGQWVYINGLTSTTGQPLNRGVFQVSATGLSSSSFTVGIPFNVASASSSDTGTATTTNVTLAFNPFARYNQSITNVNFTTGSYFSSNVQAAVGGTTTFVGTYPTGASNALVGVAFLVRYSQSANNGLFVCTASTSTTITLNNPSGVTWTYANLTPSLDNNNGVNSWGVQGVGIYYGGRVDTGTRLWSTTVSQANLYGVYFADGGINVDVNEGSRFDGIGVAGVYWHVAASDSLAIENGTIDTTTGTLEAGATEGAAIMLDDGACGAGATYSNTNMQLLIMHEKIEINVPLNPGIGAITMYDCPGNPLATSFKITTDQLWIADWSTSVSSTNVSPFAMIPANDSALSVAIKGSSFIGGTGANTSPTWAGLSAVQRQDMSTAGQYPLFTYSPTVKGSLYYQPDQLFNETNFAAALYQYKTRASLFEESDTAFAAFPNGTNLPVGSVIAPPAYWQGSGNRFALQSVYQAGTVGTPNGGSTTCSGSGYTLTCTSATDLSVGQHAVLGAYNNITINFIDATNPSAVLVKFSGSLPTLTNQALTYLAPLLGPEIILPTKTSADPSGGGTTWSQGDIVLNSGATANGIAARVNVAGGAPGTWAAVPLGNSSGVLAPAQIGTGTPSAGTYVDGATGAWTAIPARSGTSTAVPAWLQYLGNGTGGSYEVSPTGSCTTSPTHCVTGSVGSPYSLFAGIYKLTALTIDSGAYVVFNADSHDPVFHVTGACTINGSILADGAHSTWPSNAAVGGAPGGGGGGGSGVASAGKASYPSINETGLVYNGGGSAGTSSGGNGGNASAWTADNVQGMMGFGFGFDIAPVGGNGGSGGSTGGAGGVAGSGVVLICGSIDGTGGSISVNGANGANSAANNTGAGGGGGGGAVILSSQASVSTWPTITVAGGSGGTCGSYTGCGTGGNGAAGWYAEFSGW